MSAKSDSATGSRDADKRRLSYLRRVAEHFQRPQTSRQKFQNQTAIEAPNHRRGGDIRRTAESFSELNLTRQSTQHCAAKDCSTTLVEIADELGDPPFSQLIAFSVLPLASSHYGSLSGKVLLRGTNRRLADCSFPHLLIHFLQGFAYWNEWRFMSFWQLTKLNSAIRRIPFLVLFSPIFFVLRLSVHASAKTLNT
uniref:Uncharacterized protein n=1 Tax=Solanum tuberosum TaxID=4113 RepID=M1D8X2_SOLTU